MIFPKYIPTVSLLAYLLIHFTACTTTKITKHFLPSITDHTKVFKCDTIYGSGTTTATFPSSYQQQLPPYSQWIPPTALKDGYNIKNVLKNSGTNALIIAHNDSIIYQAYRNDSTYRTPQMVFSITKGIVAVLCHIAAQEGYWTMEDKIGSYIPEFKREKLKDITVQHLLDMTSGLKWDDEVNFKKMAYLYYSGEINKHAVKKAKAVAIPGTQFAYGSLSTQLLTECLEQAIGKSTSLYLQEKIWTPAGMQDNAYFTLDNKKDGTTRGFAGLAISPRDLLRFGKLLKNDGVWKNKQIIPKSLINNLKTRQTDGQQWWGYSNCFWRNAGNYNNIDSLNYFAAVGHLGQFVYVDPDHNLLIIRTAFKQPFKWSLTIGRLAKLITDKVNHWTNPNLGVLNQFEGIYQAEDGSGFQLKEKALVTNPKKQFSRSWKIIEIQKSVSGIPSNVKTLYDFDETSIGFIKIGTMIRLQAQVENGKIVGIYVDNRKDVKPQYYYKMAPVKQL